MSILTAFEALRKRKGILLLSTLALTAASALYALWVSERYRAQALLAVDTMRTQAYVKAPVPASAGIPGHLRLIREILYSRPLLEAVQEFRPHSAQGPQAPEQALEEMKRKVKVQVEGPDSFYITFEGEDRHRVTDVTNRLAELLVTQAAALSSRRVEEATGFLQAELDRVHGRLREQEEKVRKYKQSAGTALPEYLGGNMKLYEMHVDRLQATTEKASNEQARRTAVQREIQELEQQGPLSAGESSPGNPQLDELRLKLKQLQTRYTDQHPEVMHMQKEIGDLEKQGPSRLPAARREPSALQMRYLGLKAEKEAIDQRLESYRRERQGLSSELARYEGRLASAPRHETSLASLMRDYETTRLQYEALLQKQQEAAMAERMEKEKQGVVFRIVEPASLPPAPLLPRRLRVVLVGLLSGLCLGLALALIAEQRDTSFEKAEQLYEFTTLPLLAVVPSITVGSRRSLPGRSGRRLTLSLPAPEQGGGRTLAPAWVSTDKTSVVTLSDPFSIAAEQYNLLALKVHRQLAGNGARILLVASAAGGEGKTVTAVNLAVALSRISGDRVLLVDADLRKPSVHRCLGLDLNKGFTDFLAKPEDSLGEYLRQLNGLSIFPGSRNRLIPVSALSPRNLGAVFARFRREFQFIVVDSPPLVPIADSHVLAGLSDGVVVVARARTTSRELFQAALENLRGANLLGVVLNDVDFERSRYAYAYQYYEKNYRTRTQQRK